MLCMFSHPQAVCMTYIEHACFSIKLAYLLAMGSVKAIVHAFIPDLYVTSSSDLIKRLEQEMSTVGCS